VRKVKERGTKRGQLRKNTRGEWGSRVSGSCLKMQLLKEDVNYQEMPKTREEGASTFRSRGELEGG